MESTVSPECNAELVQAARWHQVNADNGDRLIKEFGECLLAIVAEPTRFPRPSYYRGKREIRRKLLDHFPYAIVYQIINEQIIVIAIAHTSRRPGYWLKRIV